MSCPTMRLSGREIIVMSGFEKAIGVPASDKSVRTIKVADKPNLEIAVRRHPEADVFGYVAGKWFPVA